MQQLTAIPRVLAVGSCRVRRPLRSAHAAGEVELINDTGAAWFTHSAAEAIQYVRSLRGEVALPPFYRELICENGVDLPVILTNPEYLDVDAAVVELCTLKSVSLDGYYLNVQMVSSLAWRTDGVDPWSVLHGLEVEWPETLGHMRRVGVTTYDEARLRKEIAELKALLAVPIVIVDHIPATGDDGCVIPDRAALTQMLQAVCDSEGVEFLPTTELLAGSAVADVTKDVNHWNTDFEPVAGRQFADTVRRLCSSH